MKRKSGYVIHSIAGENLVLSEDSVDLNSLMNLNETGLFLWQKLQQETDEQTLLQAVLAEYDVDAETAGAHIFEFIKKLKELDLLA